MGRLQTPPRKSKYRTPDEQLRQQDARRLEIMEEAKSQSAATGCDESDFLESLLIQEAVDRARGDPERALFIFDMELEQIQRDQTLDAIDKLTSIVKEAAAEAIAAGFDYKTVADETDCNLQH